MAVILDHLTAILVGASLLGVLLFVQQRGNQTSVEATIHHSVQTQSFSLAETLERDIENIRNSNLTGEPAHVEVDGENTATLRFITLEDHTLGDSSPLVAVAYRLENTHQQVLVNGVPETVYRLARYVNDGSGYVLSGSSAETLVGFNVSLISADTRSEITNGREPDEFGIVQVVFSSAQPHAAMAAGDQANRRRSNQTRQGLTLRPPGLSVERTSSSPTVPSLWASLPESPYETTP
ncbi:MAG: hypothetical protein R3284_02240 [Rubricoccaceae bacterium]|nr:hypothetical protein [Rubricoccaceae bacterium]